MYNVYTRGLEAWRAIYMEPARNLRVTFIPLFPVKETKRISSSVPKDLRASSRLFIVTLSRFLKESTNSLMFPTETGLIEAEMKLKQKGEILN